MAQLPNGVGSGVRLRAPEHLLILFGLWCNLWWFLAVLPFIYCSVLCCLISQYGAERNPKERPHLRFIWWFLWVFCIISQTSCCFFLFIFFPPAISLRCFSPTGFISCHRYMNYIKYLQTNQPFHKTECFLLLFFVSVFYLKKKCVKASH